MGNRQDWWTIEAYDGGGQGKVYRVCKRNEFEEVLEGMRSALRSVTGGISYGKMKDFENSVELSKWLSRMVEMEKPENQFALKVLHKPQDARDPKLAKERIKSEIDAMRRNLHPNLIELVDSDPDGEWFVSRFYPGGTLAQRLENYKGDFLSVLKVARPIIEGVAKLHEEGFVHRDIKPANIFIGVKGELVLGDFGLIHFEDAQHTRVSDIFENVGSRDWMPGWAMGMRLDEVRPTFDVFSLGKVLWSMTSGMPILQLWYFDRKRFNVESMFPKAADIQWANPLFKKCIVEKPEHCLPNAGALLEEVERTIALIESNADHLDLAVNRKCEVCGLGDYALIADEDFAQTHNFGLSPTGDRLMKIFTCTHCGNVQMFSYRGGEPPAWRK